MNVQDAQKLPFDLQQIFTISSEESFREIARSVYAFQLENNKVYRDYVHLLGRQEVKIEKLTDIPFLPISFFKTHELKTTNFEHDLLFESSGTTGQVRSQHWVADKTIYQLSFLKAFEQTYGHIQDYIILGLLPSYMENNHSSLIYMVDHLIEHSSDPDSGFFLNDYEHLLEVIERRKGEKKILLIGVSYALLDLGEKYGPDLSGCIVMETGGMKGRRKEMTKTELHTQLKHMLNVDTIHSEYGMTELLSQAYSTGDERFHCPPWMKILVRDHNDPLNVRTQGSGGINVIDLANIFSCSFIATEDLGKLHSSGFEVLGRFDNSDLRGCNLLIQ